MQANAPYTGRLLKRSKYAFGVEKTKEMILGIHGTGQKVLSPQSWTGGSDSRTRGGAAGVWKGGHRVRSGAKIGGMNLSANPG